MKAIWLIPVALCLSAAKCGDPGGIEVRTVPVPVAQPCMEAKDIPEEPPKVADTLTGNWDHDGPIVSASALDLRAWGQIMHTALTACAN